MGPITPTSIHTEHGCVTPPVETQRSLCVEALKSWNACMHGAVKYSGDHVGVPPRMKPSPLPPPQEQPSSSSCLVVALGWLCHRGGVAEAEQRGRGVVKARHVVTKGALRLNVLCERVSRILLAVDVEEDNDFARD